MKHQTPTRLLVVILAVIGLAIVLIAADPWVSQQHARRSREFQELLHGLGMGPSATLSLCEFSFDPRIVSDWRTGHDPLVCGEAFCPRHASSVFYLPPLNAVDARLSETPTHASDR